MKCDEQLPVCQNCINSKRKCYRGIRLNFTQYTIYDPHKSLSAAGLSTPPTFFRLLDQLIAVLAQYKDGKNSYRKYLHLHTKKDLDEAELRHHQDMNCQRSAATPAAAIRVPYRNPPIHESADTNVGDPWFLRHGPEPVNFSENTILESFDIKNLLMNPALGPVPIMAEEPAISTSFAPMVDFNPQATPDPPEPWDFSSGCDLGHFLSSFDSHAFVKLIQSQHYYWVLDLFNEVDIWKAVVPSYCVRIVQAAENDEGANKRNPYFLLNCLMDCKEYTSMDRVLRNAHQQLVQWKEFDHGDVTAASFKAFEQILLSIVLILLSMLLQVIRPSFRLTDSFVMVLANQGKLLRKVVARYERCPEPLAKTMAGSLMSAASFQAIVILRFLLEKQLKKMNLPHDSLVVVPYNEIDVLASTISYGLNVECNVQEFFVLTPFEERQLSSKFQEFDIAVYDKRYPSDASKLRLFFWSLVEFDNDSEKADIDFLDSLETAAENPHKDTSAWALRPSDKCIAFNILAAYAHKARSKYTVSTARNTTLHEIFQKINDSLSQEKANWTSHFRWTLEN